MRRIMSLMVAAGVLVGGGLARSGGPAIRGWETLKANHFPTHTWVFRSGEVARIFVSGDGDTDLDLYVDDQNGNLVARDEDDTDDCLVEWNHRWTGKFTVKVVNRGSIDDTFSITTD